MGLKFGIHIMRGTSTFAASRNCLIKNAQPKARIRDIVAAPCSWSTYSLSVNVSMSAGVQFYRSLLEQCVPLYTPPRRAPTPNQSCSGATPFVAGADPPHCSALLAFSHLYRR
eukprot:SAG31_NODE_18492_length_634_cov_0.856075_1_plen_112_part_01